MAEERVTNELIYETLKRLQKRLVGMDAKLDGLGADMRGVKGHMAAFMGNEVVQDTGLANLSARIDRIERRLELKDAD